MNAAHGNFCCYNYLILDDLYLRYLKVYKELMVVIAPRRFVTPTFMVY